MSRLLKFTYNSLVIGKDQVDDSYVLTGKYAYTTTETEASVTFDVVVRNATRATFLTAEAALIAAYNVPNQALDVTLGTTARHTFDPATGTGFLARPQCRKVPGRDNTANSARYRCSVVVQLPAGYDSRVGRRSASVDVTILPTGWRVATFTGVWTAISTTAARAQWAAQFDTWAANRTSALGGNWERSGTTQAEADDEDKLLRFTVVYKEIDHNQGVGTTDVAALKNQVLTFTRKKSALDSSTEMGGVAPLVAIEAEYAVDVDKDTTTDLKTLWESTCRPHIINEAEAISEGGRIIVQEEAPNFDRSNRISARMILLADPGASFYQATVSYSDKLDRGVVLRPRWDGDPFSRERYQGMASWVRTLRRTTVGRRTSSGSPWPTIKSHKAPPKMEGFIEVRENRRLRRFNIGIQGDPLPMEAITTTYTFVRANTEGSVTGGGSDSGGTYVPARWTSTV